jgi:hypothetical protein
MESEPDINKIQAHFNQLNKTTREFTGFLNLIIEETIKKLPDEFTPTNIKCHKKGCDGIISIRFDFESEEILWKCSDCDAGGNIKNSLP